MERRRKYLLTMLVFIGLISLLALSQASAVRGSAFAEMAGAPEPTPQVKQDKRKYTGYGSVSGTINIQEVSGNNVGNFTCDRIKVMLKMQTGGWEKTVSATGNFGSRKCSFSISNIPSGKHFSLFIPMPEFPNACDEKKFMADTSFPMEVKAGEKKLFNFRVTLVRCVLVK